MATADRIYQRTEAGHKAWESGDPGVPAEQRRILGLINGETHSDLVPGAVEHDLDFTGNFTAAELRGEEKTGEQKSPPR